MTGLDVRICLLASSSLDRLAYRSLLSESLDLEVEVESSFEPVAIWAAMRARPELVLVLSDRPTSEIREGVQMIRRLACDVRVLVVSAEVDPGVIQGWSTCVLDGYVIKENGPDDLRQAVEAITAGEPYFSDGVREILERAETEANGRVRLSRREKELLPLLARGMTLREAATRMTVSYKTADSYRTSLLRKLGLRDRVELARYAIRERIVEP